MKRKKRPSATVSLAWMKRKKKRTPVKMSVYLPDGPITEILHRLPVKTLLTFRCVCKRWCSLISSPDFISTHSISPAASPLLVLRYVPYAEKPEERYSIYLDRPGTLTHVEDLPFPFKPISGRFHFRIVGFCNGLFCLSDDEFEYTNLTILWNPAIRKSLFLPMPRVSWDSYGPYVIALGFGFDTKTQDYKVVRLACLERHGTYLDTLEVEVYILSTGLWKSVSSDGIHSNRVAYYCGSVYVNGVVHWLSYHHGENDTNSLLVFSLSDETFSEMGLPQKLVNVDSFDLSLILCGDLISLFWYENGRACGQSCAVWVMSEYGKVESWMQKFAVVVDCGIKHAVGFTGNGKFLLKDNHGDLLSYDPECKDFEDLDIGGWQYSFFSSKYVESLVMLDGNSGATADPTDASQLQLDGALKELKLFKSWYDSEGHNPL